jgi:ATP-dependent helicase HrpB
MFGCAETPTVAGGKIPILIHLLSPAQRPIQITSDLAAFWKTTYREVKKELAGRYPKHYWPENPLEAQATNRVKRRKP